MINHDKPSWWTIMVNHDKPISRKKPPIAYTDGIELFDGFWRKKGWNQLCNPNSRFQSSRVTGFQRCGSVPVFGLSKKQCTTPGPRGWNPTVIGKQCQEEVCQEARRTQIRSFSAWHAMFKWAVDRTADGHWCYWLKGTFFMELYKLYNRPYLLKPTRIEPPMW